MNPLYIDSSVASISCDRYSLIIQDKKTNRIIEKFKPRDIPYDSIIIQRPNGYITFSAVYWLVKHAISLTVLNWRGSILAQFLPEEPISNKLKLAQYQAYLDKERHLDIAKTLVETKLWRQREFLKALSNSYEIEIPSIEKINSKSTDFMRNQEARYAVSYFAEFGKACKVLGYEFKKRNVSGNNMHAPDLPNGLLNYSYAILQTYVKRAINSIGLDNSIPFLHDPRRNAGLIYDLMELWRTNCDYSILQTLDQLKRMKRTHFLTDGYEVMLEQETVRTLIEKIRFNLSLEEILFNCRIFAKFMVGKSKTLSFSLGPIQVRPLFETDQVKGAILSKSFRELGMNKSTLWYQKRRLEQTGSLKLYNKTRQYYV